MFRGRPAREAAQRKKEAMRALVEQGFSAQQIARMAGISAQAVHVYLRRHEIIAPRLGRSDPHDTKKVDNLIRVFNTPEDQHAKTGPKKGSTHDRNRTIQAP